MNKIIKEDIQQAGYIITNNYVIKEILALKIISKETGEVLAEWKPLTINENDYTFSKETKRLHLPQLPHETAGN